jgi:hypothetical protein
LHNRGLDQCSHPRRRFDPELQDILGRILQQATGLLQQHPELGLGMSRTRCFTILCRPPAYSAICTAVAPDPVRTRRMNTTRGL